MDAANRGWNRTRGRIVAGFVCVTAATLLAGGTATAGYHATSVSSAHQQSALVTSDYFGMPRTTAGYIPGL
jgi:hypothetical protein